MSNNDDPFGEVNVFAALWDYVGVIFTSGLWAVGLALAICAAVIWWVGNR